MSGLLNRLFGPPANANAAASATAAAQSASAHAALVRSNAAIANSALQGCSRYDTTGSYHTGPHVSGFYPPPQPQEDPFVYASRVAAMQPADKRWRRFQHALFLVDHVIGLHGEGSGSICVRLHIDTASQSTISDYNYVFTLPFDCADPVLWFAEHVLNMEFPNARHAT